jgi:hypothetical protein
MMTKLKDILDDVKDGQPFWLWLNIYGEPYISRWHIAYFPHQEKQIIEMYGVFHTTTDEALATPRTTHPHTRKARVMRNRFEGKCYRCGETVKAGDGFFERYQGGWRAHHKICCEKASERKAERQKGQGDGADK